MVVASSTHGNGFGEYQEKAWHYLLENKEPIEQQLRQRLWEHCQYIFSEFLEFAEEDYKDYEEEEDDDEDHGWYYIKKITDWSSLKCLDLQVSLGSVVLTDTGLDEVGLVVYEFGCGWDDEHNVSVVMHKNHVLASGGAAEFMNHDNLIGYIKYCQENDEEDDSCYKI